MSLKKGGRRRKGGVACFGLVWLVTVGCGEHQGPGTIEGNRLPDEVISERTASREETAQKLAAAVGAPAPDEQILFGDLHVHSTFSADAFLMSLPVLQGNGANPIANACDYARYCSALDFWSINDHAEGITPQRWRETQDSIRQCNALAGDPTNPDLVAFLGWEWSQIGRTPDDHYGHKNVILLDTEPARVPRRAIHSGAFAARAMRQRPPWRLTVGLPILDWANRQIYLNLGRFLEEIRETPLCAEGVDTRELPETCSEAAETPQLLYEKLAQWGGASLVIPHGTTWGLYTPAGSTWDKQLTATQHDPDRQRLIEVFSGHGNSEEYREWRAAEYDSGGEAVCPLPRDDYEPCCWRAGEIIRGRCQDPTSTACEERVRAARHNYLAADVGGRLTLPGTPLEEWRDCGSCRDCFLPSMNYRPGSSVQYTLALSNPDAPEGSQRFRFGFLASSDNHSARPGTGYKEFGRLLNTEARGPTRPLWTRGFVADAGAKSGPESVPFDRDTTSLRNFQVLDFERQASFFVTGGLTAVHAQGRSRQQIWDALRERRVYGTSGERILLWFELMNVPGTPLGMGSETRLAENPRFRVRAAGGFKQKPGCPEQILGGISRDRLEGLCRSECYNPSDERHRIDRIEVVRIRPRIDPRESIGELIEDPWRTLPCPGDSEGCVVEFEDGEFLTGGREHIYYVRAIQEPTLAVNAAALRPERDEQGRVQGVSPCYGDYRTPADDDCLAPNRERAWSSPIFLTPSS
jgi:hypothetical protein